MIMIRSNATQRVGKPPPPVPPRPSKSVVAEALAKSRYNNNADAFKEAAKTKSPTRHAPPPPVSVVNEIVKSRSTYSVNVTLQKPVVYERSISEEIKNSTRPVIYQSSNVNNNKVHITRKNSDVKIVNSADSFYNKDGVKIVRKESMKKIDNADHTRSNIVQVSRNNSVKLDSSPRDREKNREKYLEIRETICDKLKSNSSTLEKSCNSSDKKTYDSTNNTLEKNWDQMLNDRNHVNTLIDEMFASVLEVHFNDESNVQNATDTHLSEDQRKVIIGNTAQSNNENVTIDSSVSVNNVETSKPEENAPKTIIVIKNDTSTVDVDDQPNKKESDVESNCSSLEKAKQVKFKDQINHELLINELQCMKHDQEKILKRQRKPSMDIYDNGEVPTSENATKIQRPDWLDVGGGEVKLNTCQIIIDDIDDGDADEKKEISLDYERITKMSSLHGLPPLPKSLSGFSLLENHQGGVANPPTPVRSSSMRSTGQQIPPGHLVYPPHPKVNGGGPDVNIPQVGGTSGRKSTNLDTQLAILRREMYSLRQLDLSLLSQLWSLNESIQDFRQILQDQEDRVLSPPSPSPTPSSGEDADGDEFYMSTSSMSFRPVPPPPPATRRPSSSSNASSLG